MLDAVQAAGLRDLPVADQVDLADYLQGEMLRRVALIFGKLMTDTYYGEWLDAEVSTAEHELWLWVNLPEVFAVSSRQLDRMLCGLKERSWEIRVVCVRARSSTPKVGVEEIERTFKRRWADGKAVMQATQMEGCLEATSYLDPWLNFRATSVGPFP